MATPQLHRNKVKQTLTMIGVGVGGGMGVVASIRHTCALTLPQRAPSPVFYLNTRDHDHFKQGHPRKLPYHIKGVSLHRGKDPALAVSSYTGQSGRTVIHLSMNRSTGETAMILLGPHSPQGPAQMLSISWCHMPGKPHRVRATPWLPPSIDLF